MNPVGGKYNCLVCKRICLEPQQLECCGRLLCLSCVKRLPQCPKCRTSTDENFFADSCILKEMRDFKVSCEDSKCPWLGPVIDYQDHLDKFHESLCDEMVTAKVDSTDQAVPSYVNESVSSDLGQVVPEDSNSSMNESLTDFDQDLSEFDSVDDLIVPDVSMEACFTDTGQVVPDLMQDDKQILDNPYCSECSQPVLSKRYESHRIKCRGCLLQYNGPVYPQPDNVSQETQCLSGTSELLLNDTSKKKLSPQYTVSHNIQIKANGNTIREYEAPFDISDIIHHSERSIKEQFPIEYLEREGMIRWKIAHISNLLIQYETLLSPYFYSSPEGWKLRLQLDLALRKLNLLLTSGEFDSSLSWPFDLAVRFGILSFGKSNDLFAEFKPSPRCGRCYSSGGKGNVAASVDLPHYIFCSDFVKEDSMLINCRVF